MGECIYKSDHRGCDNIWLVLGFIVATRKQRRAKGAPLPKSTLQKLSLAKEVTPRTSIQRWYGLLKWGREFSWMPHNWDNYQEEVQERQMEEEASHSNHPWSDIEEKSPPASLPMVMFCFVFSVQVKTMCKIVTAGTTLLMLWQLYHLLGIECGTKQSWSHLE